MASTSKTGQGNNLSFFDKTTSYLFECELIPEKRDLDDDALPPYNQ